MTSSGSWPSSPTARGSRAVFSADGGGALPGLGGAALSGGGGGDGFGDGAGAGASAALGTAAGTSTDGGLDTNAAFGLVASAAMGARPGSPDDAAVAESRSEGCAEVARFLATGERDRLPRGSRGGRAFLRR